jgi:hypothetical protein
LLTLYQPGLEACPRYEAACQFATTPKASSFPLIPQGETKFDSTAGTIQFHLDSSGRVTHFILSAAEGDVA